MFLLGWGGERGVGWKIENLRGKGGKEKGEDVYDMIFCRREEHGGFYSEAR